MKKRIIVAENMVDEILDGIVLKEEKEHPYQKCFRGVLKKWNIKSPNDLPDEKKKLFFKDVKKTCKKK